MLACGSILYRSFLFKRWSLFSGDLSLCQGNLKVDNMVFNFFSCGGWGGLVYVGVYWFEFVRRN